MDVERYEGPRKGELINGKSSCQILEIVLRGMAASSGTRARIALASVMSHGESTWVSEAAFHAADRGLPVEREVSIGGVSRVDLSLCGAAIEFKSMMGMWALTSPDTEREKWFSPDVDKLTRATVPALMVITVATLHLGIDHHRKSYKAEYLPGHPSLGDRLPDQVQIEAMVAARRFLVPRCIEDAVPVRFPPGQIPGHEGLVELGAVIGIVRADDWP